MQKIIIILLFIPFLAACDTLFPYVPEPQTKNQELLVLEYSYQGALSTIEQMVDTGILKGGAAVRAEELVVQAGSAVRSARQAISAGGERATQAITIANSVVLQLVTYLETQKGTQQSWATSSLHYKHSQLFLQPSLQLLLPQSESKTLLNLRKAKVETSPMKN